MNFFGGQLFLSGTVPAGILNLSGTCSCVLTWTGTTLILLAEAVSVVGITGVNSTVNITTSSPSVYTMLSVQTNFDCQFCSVYVTIDYTFSMQSALLRGVIAGARVADFSSSGSNVIPLTVPPISG